MKKENRGHRYPMLDLEGEVYATESLLELVTLNLIGYYEAMENDGASRIAAGLVSLSNERRARLRAAYDAAHQQYVTERTTT